MYISNLCFFQQHCYCTNKTLSSWVVDLRLRVTFVSKWLDAINESSTPPRSVWLPALYYPQGKFTLSCLTIHTLIIILFDIFFTWLQTSDYNILLKKTLSHTVMSSNTVFSADAFVQQNH